MPESQQGGCCSNAEAQVARGLDLASRDLARRNWRFVPVFQGAPMQTHLLHCRGCLGSHALWGQAA